MAHAAATIEASPADPVRPRGTLPVCSDWLDNDLDGFTDFPVDPGCADPSDTTEENVAACMDMIDNDGDGFTDHPDDGGCADAMDPSEMAGPPACINGEDDDGDTFIDFPLDLECDSALDDDEMAPEEIPSTGSRLILAIASSGTLNSNTCELEFAGGDGSLECPGLDVACGDLPPGCTGGSALSCDNGIADDSRMYKIRKGVGLAVLRGDVQFALLRARQRAADFTCPTDSPLSPSGGWQGAASLCEAGFDAGEVLVRVSEDNQDSLQRYLDGDANMIEAVLPPGFDFELRATGERPLAAILGQAGDYITELRGADPFQACRPYRAVLVTDGTDSCGGDAAAAATAIANAGAQVDVLGFAVNEPGDITELQAIASAGGGEAIFLDDDASLLQSLSDIASQSAVFEQCNNLDDDCDGDVDEDFPRLGAACSNGLLGVCAAEGQYICDGSGLGTVCSALPIGGTPETCNQLDDDCDGEIDEGGVCPPPPVELCNGLDDDGDMMIDEDYPVGLACTDGQLGICQGIGHYECAPDQMGVECAITDPGEAALPFELCNGLDDDCDGALDEFSFGEMVPVVNGEDSFWIGKYEASRPDATSVHAGSLEHRACSNPGVQPWRLVTQAQAAAACADAGLRLCTRPEWELACSGPGGNQFPYGNTYDGFACNGEDYDADCTTPDGDVVLNTGRDYGCPFPEAGTCVSEAGAYDMSGNLAEWTEDALAPGIFDVRGGSFTDPAAALACTSELRRQDGEMVMPDTGFRCCADRLPEEPEFQDGFENL